jgi:hypothetical protein
MIQNKNFFEEFSGAQKSILTRLKKPRSITLLFTTIIGIVMFVLFYNNAMGRMSLKELEESLQVVRHDSKWVDKEVSSGEVKIVPAIRIKVKNIGTKPLRNINFVGVFDILESGKRVGDGYAYVFDEPLKPGETSDEISIKSKFGYKASAKSAFVGNKDWKPVKVILFAKTSAGFLKLGQYPIAHVIAGL